MDEFATKLKQIIEDYPDILQDKKALRGLLADVFPTEPKEVNLLMNGYDVGVVDLRNLPADQLALRKEQLQKRINTNFGVAESNAMWIVDTWLYALGLQAGNASSTSGSCREISSDFVNRLKDAFDTMIVFKDLQQNNFISSFKLATVYKGNIIKNLIMDCQSYTKYRPNETTGGVFVSWQRKEELPTGA